MCIYDQFYALSSGSLLQVKPKGNVYAYTNINMQSCTQLSEKSQNIAEIFHSLQHFLLWLHHKCLLTSVFLLKVGITVCSRFITIRQVDFFSFLNFLFFLPSKTVYPHGIGSKPLNVRLFWNTDTDTITAKKQTSSAAENEFDKHSGELHYTFSTQVSIPFFFTLDS